jgi:tetratricopeptide (TPR) repeat protein
MSKLDSPDSTSRPLVSPPLRFVRWQGWLGAMRERPVLAGAVALVALGLIGASTYFILYPQFAGRYHLSAARRAAEVQDFTKARQHLEACLAIWPGHGEAHFLLARTCRRAGDLTAARRHLQEARRSNWDTDDLDLELQLITAQSGAVRLVDQALFKHIGTGHRDEVYVLEALVLSYLNANFLNDAHYWCGYWIDHHPDHPRPQFLRGLILERGLQLQLAIEQYQRALAAHPELAEARLQLGRILLRGRQYQPAKEQFDAYVSLRPGDPDGMVGLARCVEKLQDPGAALDLLRPVLAKHPEHAESCLFMGKLLVDLGKFEEALPYLHKADTLHPNNLETVGPLALALRETGRVEEARVYEEKSNVLDQEFRKVEGLIKQIIATDQLKETQPEAMAKNVQLRYEAGISLLKAGRTQEGLAWLHSALQEDPHHEPSRRAMTEHFEKERKAQQPDQKLAPSSKAPATGGSDGSSKTPAR